MLRELQAKGYSRARVDGTVIRLDSVGGPGGELRALKKYEKHAIERVVDRLRAKDAARLRLTHQVEKALRLLGRVVALAFLCLSEKPPSRHRIFSQHVGY